MAKKLPNAHPGESGRSHFKYHLRFPHTCAPTCAWLLFGWLAEAAGIAVPAAVSLVTTPAITLAVT